MIEPEAAPVDEAAQAQAEETIEASLPTQPFELSEAALEALLFVAERPLSRREIGAIAGVDRETVDARLGDLEVSLAGRGIRLVAVDRPGRAGDGARGGGRSLRATSGPTPLACRRPRSRRSRSSPIASR